MMMVPMTPRNRLFVLVVALSGCSVDRGIANTTPDLSTGDAISDFGAGAVDQAAADLSARDAVTPVDAIVTTDLYLPDLATQDAIADFATPDLTPVCSTVAVSTLAGNGGFASKDGTGGPDGTAEFYKPFGVAVDSSGNVFVTDVVNEPRIRKISTDGTTTTLAGNGLQGFVDGTGGANGTTEFDFPYGVAVDDSGYVYVADTGNHRIRKVAPDGSTTTLTGNGVVAFADGSGGADGTTSFFFPFALAVDGAGQVFVADEERVRVVAPDGTTTTLAGNGTQGFVDGTGGPNGTTEFSQLRAIAVDATDTVYVADANRIRRIAPSGMTTTLAGNGSSGATDGSGGPIGTATFNDPCGLAIDVDGSVYVGDTLNQRIRKIDPSGETLTIAGSTFGYQDGTGCSSLFDSPAGLALISGKALFVGDSSNGRVRAILPP